MILEQQLLYGGQSPTGAVGTAGGRAEVVLSGFVWCQTQLRVPPVHTHTHRGISSHLTFRKIYFRRKNNEQLHRCTLSYSEF